MKTNKNKINKAFQKAKILLEEKSRQRNNTSVLNKEMYELYKGLVSFLIDSYKIKNK